MPHTQDQVSNVQGGKVFGQVKERQSSTLSEINKEFLEDSRYNEIEEIEEKLESIKRKFIEYDERASGFLEINDVKRMLELLGIPKTHLEVKKQINEYDFDQDGKLNYREFVTMLLGKHSAVLKLILKFETLKQQEEKPAGPPPKKAIGDLP